MRKGPFLTFSVAGLGASSVLAGSLAASLAGVGAAAAGVAGAGLAASLPASFLTAASFAGASFFFGPRGLLPGGRMVCRIFGRRGLETKIAQNQQDEQTARQPTGVTSHRYIPQGVCNMSNLSILLWGRPDCKRDPSRWGHRSGEFRKGKVPARGEGSAKTAESEHPVSEPTMSGKSWNETCLRYGTARIFSRKTLRRVSVRENRGIAFTPRPWPRIGGNDLPLAEALAASHN